MRPMYIFIYKYIYIYIYVHIHIIYNMFICLYILYIYVYNYHYQFFILRQMSSCPPTRGALASSDVDDVHVKEAADEIVRAGQVLLRRNVGIPEKFHQKPTWIGSSKPKLLWKLQGISVEVLLKAAGIILEPWHSAFSLWILNLFFSYWNWRPVWGSVSLSIGNSSMSCIDIWVF